jgi:hypothetical protein
MGRTTDPPVYPIPATTQSASTRPAPTIPAPNRPPPTDPSYVKEKKANDKILSDYLDTYDKYKGERYKYPIFIQAYEDFGYANKNCNNLECKRGVQRYKQILLDSELQPQPDTLQDIDTRLSNINKENTYRTNQINEKCSCIEKRPVRKTIVYNDSNSHIADSSKGALRFMQDDTTGRVYIEKEFKDAKNAPKLLKAEHDGYHNIRHALRSSKQRAMMDSYQYPTFLKNESSSISMDKMGEIGILGWLKKCKQELYNTKGIEDIKTKEIEIKNIKTKIRGSIEYIIDQLKMFVVGINSENVFHCDLHPENIMVTYDHTQISDVTGVFVIDFELTKVDKCKEYRASTMKFGAVFIMKLAAITKSVYFDISKHQSLVDDNKVKVEQKFRTDNNMSDHAMLHSIMALFLYKYNRMTKETYIFDRGSTVLDITGKDDFIKKYSM